MDWRVACWGVGEFVIDNADYPDWDTLAKGMADYIHYRNGPRRDQRLIKAERRLLIDLTVFRVRDRGGERLGA